MYTVHKNVQILLALLKKYNIRQLVLSAGTRHIPLVFSVEDDDFFQCYSVVDERSAGFFALGLIQKTKEPAAIVCTSGTAACNYVSAANEAFYQHLPLVILTSDRNHYYLNQQEDQCVPQINLYRDVCKKVVDLPIVRDDKDAWYCGRLVNEALLELDHREKGPVHINFQIDDNYPIEQGTFKFEVQNLPVVTKIDRITCADGDDAWRKLVNKMHSSKILIIYGQHTPVSNEEKKVITAFAEEFNCAIATDMLSNLHTDYTFDSYVISGQINKDDLDSVSPDIVITMNGNSITPLKRRAKEFDRYEHWHVSANGEVSDPYMKLCRIVECDPFVFFERSVSFSEKKETQHTYYESWMSLIQKRIHGSPNDCVLDFSSVYAVQQLMNSLPAACLLHIANSNSIRIANNFTISADIPVYCNRGTCGIDGSMSTFVAQSYINDNLSFLIIGDLSFFYDMNALWNQYVNPRMRILLCNNSGGAIFHSQFYKSVQNFSGIDDYIAAAHDTKAEDWAKSRGFRYLSAVDKEEFQKALTTFMSDAEQPMLFEVFTDKDIDIRQMGAVTNSVKSATSASIHNAAAGLPDPLKRTIKNILGRK